MSKNKLSETNYRLISPLSEIYSRRESPKQFKFTERKSTQDGIQAFLNEITRNKDRTLLTLCTYVDLENLVTHNSSKY